MNINSNCTLFEKQDAGDQKNKNLAANLTKILERLIDFQNSEMFSPAGKFVVTGASDGVYVVLCKDERIKEEYVRKSKEKDAVVTMDGTKAIKVTNYGIYTKENMDEIVKEIIAFFHINLGDPILEPAFILKILKKSAENKRAYDESRKTDRKKEFLCDARSLAAYIMFRTRIEDGVNVVKYNKQSINTLLFYMRAASLTCGYGPLYEGDIEVEDGKIETPASKFIEQHINEGKIYCKAEYEGIELNKDAKEIADAVLAMMDGLSGAEGDRKLRESLDYHQTYTSRAADKSLPKIIGIDEMITDFSTWTAAQEACKEKLGELGGSVYNQAALPLFN